MSRRQFPLNQIHSAAEAVQDGRPVAVVVADRGVIVMKWFPLNRMGALHPEDGNPLSDDETKE